MKPENIRQGGQHERVNQIGGILGCRHRRDLGGVYIPVRERSDLGYLRIQAIPSINEKGCLRSLFLCLFSLCLMSAIAWLAFEGKFLLPYKIANLA